jgi:hypothetical protein
MEMAWRLIETKIETIRDSWRFVEIHWRDTGNQNAKDRMTNEAQMSKPKCQIKSKIRMTKTGAGDGGTVRD